VATLTYREAARMVRRSVRTIKRWRSSGMPMTWETRHGQRVRVVDEDLLFATLRDRLDANPAHQYRLRRRRAEAATAHSPP
jgi:transposase